MQKSLSTHGMLFQHQQVKLLLSCLLQIYHASNELRLHILYLVHHNIFLTACVTSSFTILMAAFPAILRSTSLTPIARKPAF